MFAFALDTLEKPQIISLIENVKNLESNKTNFGFRKLRLINVENPTRLKLEIEKAIDNSDNHGCIYLLDQNNSILTGTFINNIKISKSDKNNLSLSGYVWHQPKGYYKAWKMKMNNQINDKNIWKNFEKNELQGWLVFALNNMNTESSKEDLIIEINGDHFNNLDEFFCTLGEEINGVAGYFGRNIPALYDCMRGGFGVNSIEKLTWKNHQKSKKLFKSKFCKYLKILMLK
ncbi:barstar family protein [Chryseobacterium sp. YIM B08800]|uniref:barstar family protein n=1 Tax=Chryseobacterium sp. YIM B08800 TaxID=2984136 RepID=UPI00223FB02E|nr:barstar family protein [Chryseobacterium sp. YIM B08800]